MRTLRFTGFSGQTDGARKRRRVSVGMSSILLVLFPPILSNHSAQDNVDRRVSTPLPRYVSFWNGFHERAASLEVYANLHPEDANAHYQYGEICLKGLHTAGSARVAFKRAISLKPDFAEAHNGLGWAYFDLWGTSAAFCLPPPMPDVRHAIEAFELAIACRSDYSDPYLGLGCAYMWMADYSKALGYLKRVIELDPNNGDAWDMLSRTYEELTDYDDAIGARLQTTLFVSDKKMETAIECDHRFPPRHLADYLDLMELGRLYEKTQQYHAAIQVYEQAVLRNPDEPQAYHHLGLAYSAKGDKASALTQYRILQAMCLHADPETACEHFAEDLIDRIRE